MAATTACQRLFLATYPALAAAVRFGLPGAAAHRPLRLFGVAVHELGHAAAATLCLSEIDSVQVDQWEGGGVAFAPTALSVRLCHPRLRMAVISPAGYLGEAALGVALLAAAAGPPAVAAGAAVGLALLLAAAAAVIARRPRLRFDAALLLLGAAASALGAAAGGPLGRLAPQAGAALLLGHAAHDVRDDTVDRFDHGSDADVFAAEVLRAPGRGRAVGLGWWLAIELGHLAAGAGAFVLLGGGGCAAGLPPDAWMDARWVYGPVWTAVGLAALARLAALAGRGR